MKKDKFRGIQVILLGFHLLFEALLNLQVMVSCCNPLFLDEAGTFQETKCTFTLVWRKRLFQILPKVGLPLLVLVVLCSCQAETYVVVTHYNLA